MTEKYYRRLSNTYIFLISVSSIPLLYFSAPLLDLKMIPQMLFWFALQIISDIKPVIRLKSGKEINILTMSFVVQTSAFIVLGTAEALWVIIPAALLIEFSSAKSAEKAFFNAGQYGLCVFSAGSLFRLLKQSPENIYLDLFADLLAVLVAMSVFFLLNNFFVALVISLKSKSRFINMFFNDFKMHISYLYSLAPMGITAAMLYSPQHPYIILILLPPVVVAEQAIRKYYSLNEEAEETLKILADIIDERDEYTYSHSVRVAEYATKIAQQLGLSSDVVNEIEAASRIHDLGKVGIEDRILKKQGKLNENEFEEMKKHPAIAYRLLKNLKPYKKSAEYVLYHHVHFDGSGYPEKQSKKPAPLGSRIIAVADSFDAMTSNRTYRKTLTCDEAVTELQRCSGKQFDPKVVEAFTSVLKNEYNYKGDAC